MEGPYWRATRAVALRYSLASLRRLSGANGLLADQCYWSAIALFAVGEVYLAWMY